MPETVVNMSTPAEKPVGFMNSLKERKSRAIKSRLDWRRSPGRFGAKRPAPDKNQQKPTLR